MEQDQVQQGEQAQELRQTSTAEIELADEQLSQVAGGFTSQDVGLAQDGFIGQDIGF